MLKTNGDGTVESHPLDSAQALPQRARKDGAPGLWKCQAVTNLRSTVWTVLTTSGLNKDTSSTPWLPPKSPNRAAELSLFPKLMPRKDPMKRTWFICLLQCLTATFLLSQSNTVPRINSSARVAGSSAVSVVSTAQADPKAQAKILDQYGKLPLSFEANHGQADSQVKF